MGLALDELKAEDEIHRDEDLIILGDEQIRQYMSQYGGLQISFTKSFWGDVGFQVSFTHDDGGSCC